MGKKGNEVRLILKRCDVSKPLVFMVAAEDLYDKLLKAHIYIGYGTKRMVICSEKKFRRLRVSDTITLSQMTFIDWVRRKD